MERNACELSASDESNCDALERMLVAISVSAERRRIAESSQRAMRPAKDVLAEPFQLPATSWTTLPVYASTARTRLVTNSTNRLDTSSRTGGEIWAFSPLSLSATWPQARLKLSDMRHYCVAQSLHGKQ